MDCSKHPKAIVGITDMKVLAEMIGDLHYETLAELFLNLHLKLLNDAKIDKEAGRLELGGVLLEASCCAGLCNDHIKIAWQISKPYMQ